MDIAISQEGGVPRAFSGQHVARMSVATCGTRHREIAERLDVAIGKIRAVLGEGDKEARDEHNDSDKEDDGEDE